MTFSDTNTTCSDSDKTCPDARTWQKPRRGLTTRQIEVLRAVMVSGSLADAGRLLNVSASGLSRLVKYTEECLGYRLFERRGGRMVPARTSRAFFQRIDDIYRRVEELRDFMQDAGPVSDRELNIAATSCLAHSVVPRAIARLRRERPGMGITFAAMRPEEAIEALLSRQMDLIALDHVPDHPMIEFTPMTLGELVCLVPEAHPFVERDAISIRDIAGLPLISLASDEPSRRVAADLFASINQISDIAVRALSATSVQALVKAGLGVALVDHFTLFEELTPGVAARRVVEPTFFATGIATRRDKELSQPARQFIDLFAKETATAAAAMRERLDRSERKPPLERRPDRAQARTAQP